MLALISHEDIFQRGIQAVYHFQCESYYNAVMYAADSKCLVWIKTNKETDRQGVRSPGVQVNVYWDWDWDMFGLLGP